LKELLPQSSTSHENFKRTIHERSTIKGGVCTKDELFIRAKDVKYVVHKTHGRHSTLIVTERDMGAKGFILGVHSMDPGGFAPEHSHEKEQEAMYFFSGEGIAAIGGKEYVIEPDSVMLAQPKVRHSIRNAGRAPLRFVFVYCPPLPEHLSRKEYFKRAEDRLGHSLERRIQQSRLP